MSEEQKQYISVILSEKAYTLLQTTIEKKGDLNELFQKAIENVTWEKASLFTRRKTPPLVKQTQILIDAKIYKVMSDQAQKSQVDLSKLVNLILTLYYSQMIEEEWTHVGITLSEKADELLRSKLRRKGDIAERFREAILGTNWDTVEVLQRRKTHQAWKASGFTIQRKIYEKLKQSAKKRGVEITALIDAIIISYYSQPDNKT